jgi:hypothetical protein
VPYHVGFEVLTAVVINVAIFQNIDPCSPYMNRLFGRRILSLTMLVKPYDWILYLGYVADNKTVSGKRNL